MPLPITTTSAFALLRRGSAAATSVPAHRDLLFSFSTFIISTAYLMLRVLPSRSVRLARDSVPTTDAVMRSRRINGMLMQPGIAGSPNPSSIVDDRYLGPLFPPLGRLA